MTRRSTIIAELDGADEHDGHHRYHHGELDLPAASAFSDALRFRLGARRWLGKWIGIEFSKCSRSRVCGEVARASRCSVVALGAGGSRSFHKECAVRQVAHLQHRQLAAEIPGIADRHENHGAGTASAELEGAVVDHDPVAGAVGLSDTTEVSAAPDDDDSLAGSAPAKNCLGAQISQRNREGSANAGWPARRQWAPRVLARAPLHRAFPDARICLPDPGLTTRDGPRTCHLTAP